MAKFKNSTLPLTFICLSTKSAVKIDLKLLFSNQLT
jgi:hypothetical protein